MTENYEVYSILWEVHRTIVALEVELLELGLDKKPIDDFKDIDVITAALFVQVKRMKERLLRANREKPN